MKTLYLGTAVLMDLLNLFVETLYFQCSYWYARWFEAIEEEENLESLKKLHLWLALVLAALAAALLVLPYVPK